jgi:hypothetical protein
MKPFVLILVFVFFLVLDSLIESYQLEVRLVVSVWHLTNIQRTDVPGPECRQRSRFIFWYTKCVYVCVYVCVGVC